MELLVESAGQTGRQRRVIVPSRVIAAPSQLEPAEQAAVHAALQDLGRVGVQGLPGIGVKKLEADLQCTPLRGLRGEDLAVMAPV